MNSAEWLDQIIEIRKNNNWFQPNMLGFHKANPSTFHNGAFIFADGSIWWAR